MPATLGSAINETCTWVFGTKFLGGFFRSTFWTAILITSILMLCVMYMYPPKKNTPIFCIFRVAFYVFVFTLLTLFIHDGVISMDYQSQSDNAGADDLVNKVTDSTRNSLVSGGVNIRAKLSADDDGGDSDGGDSDGDNDDSNGDALFDKFGV